jgi:hypothetical protein
MGKVVDSFLRVLVVLALNNILRFYHIILEGQTTATIAMVVVEEKAEEEKE